MGGSGTERQRRVCQKEVREEEMYDWRKIYHKKGGRKKGSIRINIQGSCPRNARVQLPKNQSGLLRTRDDTRRNPPSQQQQMVVSVIWTCATRIRGANHRVCNMPPYSPPLSTSNGGSWDQGIKGFVHQYHKTTVKGGTLLRCWCGRQHTSPAVTEALYGSQWHGRIARYIRRNESCLWFFR